MGQFMYDLAVMFAAFAMNVVFVWAIIHFLYFKKSRRRDFYFTFLLISIAIFFLMYFMIFMLDSMKGKTGIGIGIGLFGIFSIMRYRTDTMPVREMTYLFSIICLSVVNALSAGQETLSPIMLVPNVMIALAIWLSEWLLLRSNEVSKLIQYDRLALIAPEKRAELVADLKQRTGLEVTRVSVGSIDLLRDSAVIKVYYKLTDDWHSHVNHELKIPRYEWEEVQE